MNKSMNTKVESKTELTNHNWYYTSWVAPSVYEMLSVTTPPDIQNSLYTITHVESQLGFYKY